MVHESIVKIDKRLSELEGLVKNCDKESMTTVSIISHSLGPEQLSTKVDRCFSAIDQSSLPRRSLKADH